MHRPGDIIDERYLLVKLLGVRAAAELWEAEHEVVGRKVTLKFLPGNMEEDPALHSMLVGEARASVEIRHPIVVEVYDVGVTPAGEAYLVTEPLRGETLADLLARRGPLAPADACRIARELLAGLEAAHTVGVVHGRLRPDTVVLRRDPLDRMVLKVLEFRVGVTCEDELLDPEPSLDPSMLEASVDRPRLAALGRPSDVSTPYAAPELALGPTEDPRADVFAVGVMLQEMLTGKAPMSDASALLGQSAESNKDGAASIPRELEDVVHCATASVPARRYNSAREMADALRSFGGADVDLAVPLRESLMPLLSTEARRSRGMARLERAVLGVEPDPRPRGAPPRDNVVAIDPARRPSAAAPPAANDAHANEARDERSAAGVAPVCTTASNLAAAHEAALAGEIKLPLPPPTPRSVPAPPLKKTARTIRHARDPRSLQRARRRPVASVRLSHAAPPRRVFPADAQPRWATPVLVLCALCVGLLVAHWFRL